MTSFSIRTIFAIALTVTLLVGSGVCRAQPATLDKSENSAGLEIQVSPKPPIRTGASLQITATARKRGYLIVLSVEPTGEVTQIFPALAGDALPFGATDETNAMKPGRPMLVPDPSNVLGNFELFASSPGTAAVIGLLSPLPVQVIGLAELPSANNDLDTAIQNVLTMVKDLRVVPRNARAGLAQPQWSIETVKYQVE